jgi:hypothetical protein
MLMRNAATVGSGGVDGMNNVGGAGLDGHAMAQLASFMNGRMQDGAGSGSLPQHHRHQQAGMRGENGGGGGKGGTQPSGPLFPYSGIHSNGQSRPGVSSGAQDGYPRRIGGAGGEHINGGRRGSMEEKSNGSRHGAAGVYGVKEDPSIGPDQIRGLFRVFNLMCLYVPLPCNLL